LPLQAETAVVIPDGAFSGVAALMDRETDAAAASQVGGDSLKAEQVQYLLANKKYISIELDDKEFCF